MLARFVRPARTLELLHLLAPSAVLDSMLSLAHNFAHHALEDHTLLPSQERVLCVTWGSTHRSRLQAAKHVLPTSTPWKDREIA